MVDPQARCEQLEDRLREQEYRLTPQHIALLRLLPASEEHPSTSDLYDQLRDQFPTTSPPTNYNTLNLRKEVEEVLAMSLSDGDKRHEGSRPFPHPRLICARSRKIVHPEVKIAQDLAEQVAQQSGYRDRRAPARFLRRLPSLPRAGTAH